MRACQRLCTAVVGGLWLASGIAWAAPPSAAKVPTYALRGQWVHVPLASQSLAGPPGMFVTATPSSLLSALDAAGWRQTCVQKAAAAPAPTDQPLLFMAADPDTFSTPGRGDRIFAWPLGTGVDGDGQHWFVRLIHGPKATIRVGAVHQQAGQGHPDAQLSLNAIFFTGTSRLGVAMPRDLGHRPLAWVRLRHAPGELTLSDAPVDLDAGVATAAAPRQGDGLPVDACTQPDLPGKTSHQPLPDAGPACEAHGALPLHPLAGEQVAGSIIWHGAGSGKRVALTFDACSTFAIGRFNPRVVAALRAEQVPATLFVGGHWAEMYPAVLEDLAQDPLFEIGNHSYSHPHMRDLSPEAQRQELLWTQKLIFERTGKVPRLFRPPYGEIDDALVESAAHSGLYTVEYDLPAGDADDSVTKLHLTNWVVGRSNPGSIVVMHMCRPNNHTADALPHIVRTLRAQGFAFCQVSDMLFHNGAGCR